MLMLTERLALIDKLTLGNGAHSPPTGPTPEEACMMEAVSWLAGEPWTDHPICACPVLSAFMRSWNDGLNTEDRNRLLKPLLPRLVGTRSTPAVEERRAYIALDWYLREMTPAFLALVPSLAPHAGILGAADEVRDAKSAKAIRKSVTAARDDAYAARAAARDAAWDAARAAAWDAARAAARAAAWDAARDAARDKLRPVVVKLQASALLMFERMLAAVQP